MPENTSQDQLKRDNHACTTYQQILKAYTKPTIINSSTFLWIDLGELYDMYCLYFLPKMMAKLASQSVREHFETIFEICMHIIECNPGQV